MPVAMQRFGDIEKYTSKAMMEAFTKAGFSKPSPIQSVCWPVALTGCDVIAVAKTGSGKTLGFLIPAFSMIIKTLPTDPRKPRVQNGAAPLAMVLAPTRELAIQIHEESVKFGNPSKIVSVAVYGGVPKGQQIRELRRGSHIVIATPGRIQDLLELDNPPVTNLNSVKYAVLDEADQMLDMGFEPAISALLGMLGEHQTMMFTATWPKAIQRVAKKHLKGAVHVQVGGEGLRANQDVDQTFVAVGDWEKEAAFVKELGKLGDSEESVLVFTNRKADCDGLAKVVRRSGITATSIHGDMDQSERLKALNLFKSGKARVVVATDVAARGLDIDGVGMVINYDFPPSGCEIWVHRVGRTGRAGRKGRAVTLFNPQGTEKKFAKELHDLLIASNSSIPDWLAPLASRHVPDKKKGWYGNNSWGGKNGGNNWGNSWGKKW
eukprot:TRINITY_DN1054_c0_g1_i1.p1 TRINITY_DN1054_c0_g1~~TRINITY_DN1054_c0_g1_i1.p1  ORF type:complete len:486 (+),score=152.18 TRINITY_DN1054_c0_g1_i1:154-1458(+)